MDKTVKILAGLLVVVVSGLIGALMFVTCPSIASWTEGLDRDASFLLILVIAGLAFAGGLLPFAIKPIARRFELVPNRFLAVTCSLLMGAPVAVRQAMDWTDYEAFVGAGWVLFPGALLIIVTYIVLMGLD